MINFFRKIRHNMFLDNNYSKYMLYAFGEIALVMIGILLALQVNNWNEFRKERVQEVKLYENLLVSLSADSTDVENIIYRVNAGINAQKFFITNSYQSLIENYSILQLEDSINVTGEVASSFFPRNSAYDQLSSSGSQALLQSEEIKTKLIELYDRKYKRYLHIDASIDQKSEFNLAPIIFGDLQVAFDDTNMRPASAFDANKLKKHYPQLVREFNSILITAYFALNSLEQCRESINELLILIRSELADLKS